MDLRPRSGLDTRRHLWGLRPIWRHRYNTLSAQTPQMSSAV